MIKLAGAGVFLLISGSFGHSSEHAGLMQIKSMAESGASARKATLAEFEKYAEQLATKYATGQDPEESQSGMNQQVRDAIGIILEYIDQMYGELVSYHNQDLLAAKCPDALSCNNTHLGTDTRDTNDLWVGNVSSRRQAHLDCRNDLKTSCSDYPYTATQEEWWTYDDTPLGLVQVAAVKESMKRASLSPNHCNSAFCQSVEDEDPCNTYDNYRKLATTAAPDCMGSSTTDDGDHFTDDFVKAASPSTELNTMEQCLDETRQWFDPLWDRYLACQCRRCVCVELPQQCHEKQNYFETEYCEAEIFRRGACNAFANCWNARFADCQPGGAECNRIGNNVVGRKTDNETGERIRCLLHVLNETDSLKVDSLLACNSADFTEINAFWDISCPDASLSCGDNKFDCDEKPLPCSSGFLSQEYSTFTAPFNSGLGNWEGQVGECKTCSGVDDPEEQNCGGAM